MRKILTNLFLILLCLLMICIIIKLTWHYIKSFGHMINYMSLRCVNYLEKKSLSRKIGFIIFSLLIVFSCVWGIISFLAIYFNVQSKSGFIIENSLSAFTALSTIFVAYQAISTKESNNLVKEHNISIKNLNKIEKAIRIVKIYKYKILPQIHKLDSNVNNIYGKRHKFMSIYAYKFIYKHIPKGTSYLKKICIKFILYKEFLHPTNKNIKNIEKYLTYQKIFKQLEIISINLRHNIANEQIVQNEIGKSFVNFMEYHYNIIPKEGGNAFVAVNCIKIYKEWRPKYD